MADDFTSINYKPNATRKGYIALIMSMYPNPKSKQAAIDYALDTIIRNADPVQLEAARKQARKAAKEAQR